MTTISVTFCVYKRLERLRTTLDLLQLEGARVFIWDNSGEPERVARVLADYPDLSPMVIHSPTNVGCWGWIELARRLDEPYLVKIDDDLVWQPGTITQLWSERQHRAIVGDWAWRMHGGYWHRTRCKPKETADYIGGRGLVLDTAVLHGDEILSCPEPARMAYEDIWLCYVAKRHGYRLVASAARFTEIEDDRATWRGVAEEKAEFWQSLTLISSSSVPKSCPLPS